MTIRATNTVVTSPRRTSQEKHPWRALDLSELQGKAIEAEHVVDVHLGETVAPFVLHEPLKAVLPVSWSSGELQMAKDDEALHGIDERTLGPNTRRRWRQMNELWERNKSPNNKLNLRGRLDYMGNLSAQQGPLGQSSESSVRLVYTQAGRPTAAIVETSNVIIDASLPLHRKLYWLACKHSAEAQYLAGVVNSRATWEAVIPLTTKNWAGNSRDVEKHLWRLPIPEYDDSDPLHREIANAAATAAEGAEAVLRDIQAQRAAKGKATSITIARREIRAWLAASDEGARVERLVAQLLTGASVSATEGG